MPGSAAAWEREAAGTEILRIARAAERLGYRYVTCSDHVLVPASRASVMGSTWYEPSATLGFVAGGTQTIGLLTHVLVLPYRHPLVTAKTYATLDRLSGGRVILGVGSGHAKPEFRILGVPFEERGRITDESIDAIRAAWTDEIARFDGAAIRFRDVTIAPRPHRVGGPPIWVGGNGAKALRRAATLGDGWIPWQVEAGEFREAVASGRRLRAEREPAGGFEWIAPFRLAHDAGREEVVAEIEAWTLAGATGLHVGVSARTLEEFLDRLEWLAVIRRHC